MTAEVEIRAVTHRFGQFEALTGVDLHIRAGRFAVLLGPSGCGKTTLLSILGGFITPTLGAVMIGGKEVTKVPPAKRPTTTMFQDYALFPHMRLGANVGFGLRMRGLGRAARDAKARAMLALVGLPDAFDKMPHELSGGQRQRVALARALAVNPDVLLLDEPLGALDLKLRRQMQDELKAIQRRVGTTFVHVTHDQEEALAIADDIIVMDHGRIMDSGSPEAIYLRPKCAFSAAFMGEANFVDATIEAVSNGAVTVSTRFGDLELRSQALICDAMAAGDAVTLCFRPEHVSASPAGGEGLDLGPATIEGCAFFGTHRRCHLVPQRAPEHRFVAHLEQSGPGAATDVVNLRVDASRLIILPRGD